MTELLLYYTVGQLWVLKVRVDAVLPCCSAYATVFNVPAASLGPTAAVAGHDAGSTGLYWPCSGAEFPDQKDVARIARMNCPNFYFAACS